MAEILEQRTTCMLQVNTSGAWRNVLTFDPAQRAAIVAGLAGLANTLGDDTTWCLHHPDGKREWLHAEDFALGGWLPVTEEEPAPLVDVMVSAYCACDRTPDVFMAWRNAQGTWLISGTNEPLSLLVYAYRPVIAPAPAPAAVQEKAA
ncbi:hypothetical protein [Rhodanobacter denitrificans]|uniref:hypothetical protein n=1 Tax=Rhodanobacter denitrificans TaxID=666685 RepID=UPI00022D81DF|nr:hypothetical protein [Rhodanobacter denitrificans]UJM85291.1 hypothetical protein LRJ86_10925 [Rhodanobacter denitrificans]